MTNGSKRKRNTKFKNYLERNKNKNAILQNLWDLAKADIRRKFVAIQA